MVNTEIRLVIFFAAKDGETLYSQLKKKKKQKNTNLKRYMGPNVHRVLFTVARI